MKHGILIAQCLVVCGLGTLGQESNAMPVSNAIAEAARARVAEALGGSPSEVTISAVAELDANGCHFLRATHRSRLGSVPGEFAVLPGGEVVDSYAKDGASATSILRACGTDASAQWWAQVITRFGGVGGLLVDPVESPSAVRKIRQAGDDYAVPHLTGGDGDRTITFFVMHYEENVPYKVVARLPAVGALEIKRTRLAPGKS